MESVDSASNTEADPSAVGVSMQEREMILMLRWVLIVATSALLLARHGDGPSAIPVVLFICAYLVSNVAVGHLLRRTASEHPLEKALVLFDAIAVSIALLLTGDRSGDFFLVYFVVLLLAALSDRLEMIAATAALITFVHLYSTVERIGFTAMLAGGDLVRLPFLFVVALFFGHMVERTRRAERDAERALSEQQLVTDLMTGLAADLKRPLGVVQAMAEVLLEPHHPPLDGEQTALARRIHADARHMMRIAQNLIDAQRIRNGALSLQPEPASLGDIVEQAIHAVRSPALLKGVTIDRDISLAVPKLPLDVVQMDRVVWNLLDNAIRCARAGGEVSVSLERRDDFVRLCVSDDGNGIPSDRVSALFEPNHRLDPRGFRSPGLGLFIAKTIVEGHGGTIEVESEPRGGATFVVSLPAPELRDERPSGHARLAFELG